MGTCDQTGEPLPDRGYYRWTTPSEENGHLLEGVALGIPPGKRRNYMANPGEDAFDFYIAPGGPFAFSITRKTADEHLPNMAAKCQAKQPNDTATKKPESRSRR